MKKLILAFVLLLTGVNTAPLWAQNSKYPPLSEYLMSSDAEIALARSAAPDSVSAHAMDADVRRAFDAGCADYIIKPIDIDTFADQVARWLPAECR